MKGVRKCGGRSGKMWGRCEKRCGGRCGEVCWSVGEVRRDVGDMGSSTHFPHLPPHFPHLPHISSFLPPHFSTPQHIFPHFLTPSIFPPYLYQLPKLLKISQFPHHPYSSKLSQIFYTSSFFPILHPPVLPIVTLSFTPHQNFSLFSCIVKSIQQSSTLETPCKFYKKKIKNKNKK